MRTVGEIIDSEPVLKKYWEILVEMFPTFEMLFTNKNAVILYQKIMMHVIAEWEREKGNVVYNGMSYKITTSFEEVKEIYGGTIVGPLLVKKDMKVKMKYKKR